MGRAFKYLLAVGFFAIAMAYIESAVVVYLRGLYEIEDLLKDTPLIADQYTIIEIGREAATLVMLAVLGWIAGRSRQERIGYAVFAFGLWDIFYYIWLNIFIGWPQSLLDWDILFLIPLPWWGPILSPVLIALLMVIGGVFAVIRVEQSKVLRFKIWDLIISCVGIALILYTFMYDALQALPNGIEAVGAVKPSTFNWIIYLIGLAGITFPLLKIIFISSKKQRF